MHRRLLLLTRDTRLPLVLTVLAGLLVGLLTIGQSYALSSTISAVFLQHRTVAQVWPWMQALLAVLAGRTFLVWLNEVAASSVAVRIKADLRARLFAHILALGPAYTRGERTGDLTAAAVEGVEALDAYFSQYLPQLVVSTLVPVCILLLVFPLDLLSGIVLLLTAPLIPFFMYMIGRGAEAVTRRQYETLSRLSAHFLDSLQGLTTLKLFGQSKAQAANIAQVSDQYRDVALKVLQVTFLSAFALELLATISTAIIAVEVGLRLLYGQMQFQEALFLLILAPEFYLPLRMLGLRFHAGMAGTSAARRIFEILDVPLPSQGRDQASCGKADLHFRTLDLEQVAYTYPGEDQAALKDISLQVRAGEHIALVGPSGAGKTTLASLLLAFMSPSCGAIKVDGRRVDEMPAEEWRQWIAWVPQRPHLFHDTIAANIRLGQPDATDEQVAAAARAAHLDQFLESLPERYSTVIGEGGARLSSGQAQRLALARAFLKVAPILIMDEPTSSLDPETESLLEASTRELMQGRTVITIAHRLNTVAAADRIIVLKAGRVVEIGTHAELLKKGGEYAKTVRAKSVAHSGETTGPASASPPEPAMRDSRPLTPPANERISTGPAEANDPRVFRRLMGFIRGSWAWVVLSVLFGSVTIGASIALMGTSSWLISMAALHPSIAALQVAIVGVRFFGIARAVFRYLERLVSHNVTFRLLGRLRSWFYERLEPLAPARLMEYRAGDLLARIIGDVNTLENLYVRVVAPPITAVIVCIATAVFLAFSDLRLALLLVLSFALLGIGIPYFVQLSGLRWGERIVRARAELQVQLVDGIQGLPDLLAFGRSHDRVQRLDATAAEYGSAQKHMARISGVHSAFYTLVTNLVPWLVLWLVIPQVDAGRLSGVMLAPLVLLTAASFEAVSSLPLAAQTWGSTRTAAQRLFELVDSEPAVRDNIVLQPRSATSGAARCIEVTDVSFTYPGQSAPALDHVSLRLEPGRLIAIVGPSGAGKSTLANLLLRFWDYDGGEICLGGRPIRSYPPDEVRREFAVVPPSPYFFNTSIYENLRMARRGLTRAEVEQAAKAAQIHDAIVKLPKGYDTLIGEQGLRLSGGERQRLAIARAILKEAPILILDEPTANLDTVTEGEILKALFELMHGKAGMLITHRLVGLDQTDEIVVMEHGRIVERGPEHRLRQQQGTYARLWRHQNRFLLQP